MPWGHQLRRTSKTPRSKRARRAGLTLLEVTVALVLITVVMLGSSAGFSSSLMAVDRAKQMQQATSFLSTVMEDLGAQPYGNLLAMNGNQFFDGNTLATSQFVLDLSVFQAEIDLLQIRATVTDRRSGDVVGTITTLRSRR